MTLLEVKNLSVSYDGFKAVQNVSFKVDKGEIVCLVGESGSGKSTILRAIAGLLPESAKVEGSALFEGKDLLKLPKRELNKIRGSLIGFIFQEPSLTWTPYLK